MDRPVPAGSVGRSVVNGDIVMALPSLVRVSPMPSLPYVADTLGGGVPGRVGVAVETPSAEAGTVLSSGALPGVSWSRGSCCRSVAQGVADVRGVGAAHGAGGVEVAVRAGGVEPARSALGVGGARSSHGVGAVRSSAGVMTSGSTPGVAGARWTGAVSGPRSGPEVVGARSTDTPPGPVSLAAGGCAASS